ncbi:hypothetical protein FSARC_13399 [Fusarium sarcochroum]|uniref:Uncharacterized protein n=1 Tax=Fusarium sarcochroum TaxID=1208366 RepID=A0A8H4T1Y0_9HYPO|nr:hypothetical protein FSARC_13399 [Fusarium sarcochroum]
MEVLKRNRTTAKQAMAIENAADNPFVKGKEHSSQYYQLLNHRRQTLPICSIEQRQAFLDKYHAENVTIVVGDTGCGKTTQILQFILFDEWESKLRVACAQPRRVAATTVADRVANEMDAPLGDAVGYHVRFDHMVSEKTRLGVLTEGSLVMTLLGDPDLKKYACVVIDDAHERTVNADIIMSTLKQIQKRRKDLKVVIMSATINLGKFKAYFGTSNVFEAQRQANAVRVRHLETEHLTGYVDAVRLTVIHIVKNKPKGDILVFLTCIPEIEELVKVLRKELPYLRVLPLYSSLPKPAQKLATQGGGPQTCVLSTNVAEASLTIPGIVYVIDCGMQKEEGYNPRVCMSTLLTAPISKASARQRTGRAGRTQPGECYRLYTKEFHDVMEPNTPPGILMHDVSGDILMVKALGYHDVVRFDWIDPPHPESYLRAIGELRDLDYIDSQFRITLVGRNAVTLPVHCVWFKCLEKARDLGCLNQMITIAALMSTQDNILVRPYDVRGTADEMRHAFGHSESDALTRLRAFSSYYLKKKGTSRNALAVWCHDSFINSRVAEEVIAIRNQLLHHIHKSIMKGEPIPSLKEDDEDYSVNIRQALLAGFFSTAAISDSSSDVQFSSDQYKTVRGNFPFVLEPGSSLVGEQHEWVICHEFYYAGIQYLKMVTAVEPEWLLEYPPFDDERLPRNFFGELKNPRVKESLDEARSKLQWEQ